MPMSITFAAFLSASQKSHCSAKTCRLRRPKEDELRRSRNVFGDIASTLFLSLKGGEHMEAWEGPKHLLRDTMAA